MARWIGFLLLLRSISSADLFGSTAVWDQRAINKLIESSTHLLHDSVRTKVTPLIVRFAESTIHKIESDVLPELEEDHKLAERLLDREYDRFVVVEEVINAKKSDIVTMDEQCERHRNAHELCRNEEHLKVQLRQECDTETERLVTEAITCEENLEITQAEIDGVWCRHGVGYLSDDFYTQNSVLLSKYIERTETCARAWDAREQQQTQCVSVSEQVHEQRGVCNTKQEMLEVCACDRANLVEHWSNHFTLVWHNLTTSYDSISEDEIQSSDGRTHEYEGLHQIVCLLHHIKELGMSDEPCNESHVEDIDAKITACHEDVYDTTHLQLNPKPAPDLPLLFEHIPFPCEEDYVSLHYNHLPSDAGAQDCQNHWCSPTLVNSTSSNP
jgi:hypothetical protein